MLLIETTVEIIPARDKSEDKKTDFRVYTDKRTDFARFSVMRSHRTELSFLMVI